MLRASKRSCWRSCAVRRTHPSCQYLLGKRLAQARETTAANTAAAASSLGPVHPCVLRYLHEIGVVR